MQNTNGLNSDNNITLSGESSAYFDDLSAGIFQGVDGTYFTGITSNIQTQIDGISGGLASSYVTLATSQNITGAKSFNTTLPTSTVAPTLSSQLVTKNYTDTTFGALATPNTWSLQNTFSTGILPRAASSATDIQIGGNNQFQYRQVGSQFNIGIGGNTIVGDSNPAGFIYNIGKRNIGIGELALNSLDGGGDNIAIGHQAMQVAGGQRIYGAGVTPNRSVAIGVGAQKTNLYGTDNISIGFNSLNNVGSGNFNLVIGSNVGGGLGDVNNNTIIGGGAAPTVVDNAMTVVGSNALGAATGQCNGGTFLGYSAGYSQTGAQRNTCIGANSGYTNLTGEYQVNIGFSAGDTQPTNLTNTICIGGFAKATESNEFVIGDSLAGSGVAPRLTLPNKTRLACNQSVTGVTITLAFRTNENVMLTDATTTQINLPTPAAVNVGCKFYINRMVSGVSININAPSGQSVGLYQSNSSYGGSPYYTLVSANNSVTVLCVGSTAGGTNWMVIPSGVSQASDNLFVSTTNVIPAQKWSVPFGGISTTQYQTFFMDNNNLNYQGSTTTLSATNLTSTGTVTAGTVTSGGIITGATLVATTLLKANTNFIMGNIYRPYETGAIAGADIALPGAPSTLYGTYFWTASTSVTTNTVIVLPAITVAMVGCRLSFRRISSSSTNVLVIKTPIGGGTIMNRNSITTTASNTNYTLITVNADITGYYGQIMAYSTSQWIVLF